MQHIVHFDWRHDPERAACTAIGAASLALEAAPFAGRLPCAAEECRARFAERRAVANGAANTLLLVRTAYRSAAERAGSSTSEPLQRRVAQGL